MTTHYIQLSRELIQPLCNKQCELARITTETGKVAQQKQNEQLNQTVAKASAIKYCFIEEKQGHIQDSSASYCSILTSHS
jgi:hypothetical protein